MTTPPSLAELATHYGLLDHRGWPGGGTLAEFGADSSQWWSLVLEGRALWAATITGRSLEAERAAAIAWFGWLELNGGLLVAVLERLLPEMARHADDASWHDWLAARLPYDLTNVLLAGARVELNGHTFGPGYGRAELEAAGLAVPLKPVVEFPQTPIAPLQFAEPGIAPLP